jgi:septum formation protein
MGYILRMNFEFPIILASASPRRRELLATLGVDFTVRVPEVDELLNPDEAPRCFAERLAREKAAAVVPDGVVIAADTIVVYAGKILGKPSDAAEARGMLSALSGRIHEVITGVCVAGATRVEVFSVVTRVEFRRLTGTEIAEYVATGEPMDKAGSYAIQGGAAPMIRAIEGSYTNVVGLPLCELYEVLVSF